MEYTVTFWGGGRREQTPYKLLLFKQALERSVKTPLIALAFGRRIKLENKDKRKISLS